MLQVTAGKLITLVFGYRKLLFHEESLSSAERTRLAGIANSLTGQALGEMLKLMNRNFTFISLLFLSNIIAQNNVNILDSIKVKVLKDTLYFNKSDIYENSIGIFNKNEYSTLFVIDEKYLYKLDIIESIKVKAFVSEFLVSDKIERLVILKPNEAQALYGSHGKQGAILIYPNSKKYNLKIANLKINTKQWGNNFSSEKTQGLFKN